MQKQWVYTFTKVIDRQHELSLIGSIREMLLTWKAHGKELNADVLVLERQLLIILMEDESIPASGCAVDTLNKEIFAILESNSVELANRNKIPLFTSERGFEFFDRSALKDSYDSGHVTLMHNLIDLNHIYDKSKGFNQFLVPFNDSWLKNYL